MQFTILAYDATDDGAPARRMAAREAHLRRGDELVRDGHGVIGAALLDDDDRARVTHEVDAVEWQTWANPEFMQFDTGLRLEFQPVAVREAALALMAASRGFDAAAPNYGPLPKDPEAVLRGACPVVASFGRRDLGLRGAAARLEQALTAAGVEHDVVEYPDAGHSFLNRHNAGPFSIVEKVAGFSYHEPSAEDAWARILRFFETHLRR